jgi:hypothetical protein
MTLSGKQWIGIIGVILNTLMTSTALFTKIWGPDVASLVVMTIGTINTMFSGIGVVLASQTNTVKDVLAMPGVEHVSVNDQANPALAAMAVDPAVSKIAPTRAAFDSVTSTAISKGTPA